MFFYEGYTCPVCQKAFTQYDDVVSCPHCGLPHHRNCWAKEGHCHLEHLHETDEQWSRSKSAVNNVNQTSTPVRENIAEELPYQICPQCHTRNPEFAEICTHCGMVLGAEDGWKSADAEGKRACGEYRPFYNSTYSAVNVSPNEELNGTKAECLAAVVGTKSEYYIPRFRRMARNGSSVSWNWAAFFFGPYWLLYRKMYGLGTIVLVLQIFQTAVTTFVYSALNIYEATTYADIFRIVKNAMDSRTYLYYFMAIWLISLIVLVVKIIVGALGNRFYLNHSTNTVLRAQNRIPDLTAGELTSLGGTTIAMAIIGYLTQYFITQILSIFFM